MRSEKADSKKNMKPRAASQENQSECGQPEVSERQGKRAKIAYFAAIAVTGCLLDKVLEGSLLQDSFIIQVYLIIMTALVGGISYLTYEIYKKNWKLRKRRKREISVWVDMVQKGKIFLMMPWKILPL